MMFVRCRLRVVSLAAGCASFAVTTSSRRQHATMFVRSNIALQSSSSNNAAASSTGSDPFERYSEIDNSNEKRIQAVRTLGLDKDEWIATEKVHGANFGVYSTEFGKSVRYSKRSGIMPHNEHFFGYHVLIPELVPQVGQVRNALCELVKENVHTVIMNGELFGGKYLHPAVPKSKQTFLLAGKPRGISAVQTDSFPQYSPNLHFYAFDIKYRRQATDEVITLTFDEATSIFEKVKGLLYAKPIIRGPMDKVAAFDVETFQTTIPPLVGMGNFPLKGNWAEGLVVKHCKRGTVGWNPKCATILKFKCVAFQEISTDRRQGPRVDQMEQVRKESIAKSGVQLPALESIFQDPSQLAAVRHLMDHICDRRLTNLLSKVGSEPFTSKTMTPVSLADLLARDALKDFLKDADDSVVVHMPIALRREIARYAVFEARRFVTQKWAALVTENGADGQPLSTP